jgi:PEP-CTERM motif
MRQLSAILVVLLASVTMMVALPIQAEAVTIFCTTPPATINCTGTLTYTAGTSTTGTLSVTLTNTSTPAINTQDVLASIALNFPTFEGATLTSATLTSPDALSPCCSSPFGSGHGVYVGETVTWTWALVGTGFGVLDSLDFTSAQNTLSATCNTGAGVQAAWGCVHFQNTPTAAASEKVRLAAVGQAIPEPGTLLLLGAGLVSAGLLGRKRASK